jgi:hypothetical protein
MSPQEMFAEALQIGAAASPFRKKVIWEHAGEAIERDVECLLGDNGIEHKEYGDKLVRTIQASLPKSEFQKRPAANGDLLVCDGREYGITNVEGDDACSPFWIVSGNAPV